MHVLNLHYWHLRVQVRNDAEPLSMHTQHRDSSSDCYYLTIWEHSRARSFNRNTFFFFFFSWQLVYLYLILQTDSTNGENPSIKKSLFPLFNSKNHLKHSSSLKKLPVVTPPMVPIFTYGSPENCSSKLVLLMTTACLLFSWGHILFVLVKYLSQFHKFTEM